MKKKPAKKKVKSKKRIEKDENWKMKIAFFNVCCRVAEVCCLKKSFSMQCRWILMKFMF